MHKVKSTHFFSPGQPQTLFSFLLAFVSVLQLQGQQIFEHYTKMEGSLQYGMGPNDFFPYGYRGYTLILPGKNAEPVGTIVILADEKINLQDSSGQKHIYIDKQAGARGLAVLYITTGIPVDLYFSTGSLSYVDTTIGKIFKMYHLPNKNIFFLGAMVSGHRALKYIEYCKKGLSVCNPGITGVVLCESAIDWVRQWYECQKQVRDSANSIKYFEGRFISFLFKENLKVSPVDQIGAYIDFSTYSYFDTSMQKPKLFKDLAIRAYTFADTRYWFSAQGYGVFDSNYPDMSGFINEQKICGNKKAELIVFYSKPDDPLKNDLRPQSATWDLVDKTALIDWMIKYSH